MGLHTITVTVNIVFLIMALWLGIYLVTRSFWVALASTAVLAAGLSLLVRPPQQVRK